MDVHQMLKLTWRRFRVLLARGFKVAEKTASDVNEDDWNSILDRAIGRETPAQVQRVSVSEITRLVN